jgi:putative MATE family efflux protein
MRLGADDRQIAAIALPALGALAAEPLYVLVDTAIVGHLGVRPLAGLALAGTLLTALTTLCNFLEYGSTSKVGALFATGDRAGAAQLGRQALILAVGLGVGLAAVLELVAGPLLSVMGAHGRVSVLAVRYLRISAIGLPFDLVAVAAGGYFRGIARLRLPLIVLLAGNVLNAILELGLVYGLHWGIAGSAAGTVIAQIVMAVWFCRAAGFGLGRPDRVLLAALGGTGLEIFVRSAVLYAAFLVAGAVLARIGTASLAAHQIAFQLWNFLALALDALAIAAQVLVSHALAVGESERSRRLAVRVLVWSVLVGVIFGAALLAFEGPLVHAFTDAPRVVNRARAVWPIFAAMQPINAAAFALDGILLGAGDTRFLMWAMLPCTIVVFLPLAFVSLAAGWGIIGIWLAIYAFITARALLTGLRLRGERWSEVPHRAAAPVMGWK